MGFSPQQVNSMSMWQLFAAAEGFKTSDGEKMSEREADELYQWLKSKE
jgi:hypothetical protein